jgi:hypothetical protein
VAGVPRGLDPYGLTGVALVTSAERCGVDNVATLSSAGVDPHGGFVHHLYGCGLRLTRNHSTSSRSLAPPRLNPQLSAVPAPRGSGLPQSARRHWDSSATGMPTVGER